MCRRRELQYGQVMRSLLGVMALAVWLLGFAAPATAETMKCRTTGINRIQESVPVGDVEGHWVGVNVGVGMSFCDTGDVTNFTALASWKVTSGKGGEALGYHLWNFVDGSTMLTKFQQSYGPPADQNFALETTQATGEILSRTGRFTGITGSLSFTGKNLKPIKGELGSRSSMDFTFTYTHLHLAVQVILASQTATKRRAQAVQPRLIRMSLAWSPNLHTSNANRRTFQRDSETMGPRCGNMRAENAKPWGERGRAEH